MNKLDANDPEYLQKRAFYEAVIISYNAAINFAKRYSKKQLRWQLHVQIQ